MCFANAGLPVTLLDLSDQQVERALETIRKNYDKSVAKAKMQPEQAVRCLQLISGATDYASISHSDLILEAVFENMALKRAVFTKLDTACRPGAVLATNTSYLDINEIAGASKHPENVIGLHFFNPAHIMKLLEIVRADRTSQETLRRCLDIARRIGKTSVVARVGFGFIGNRMLNAYRTEALNLALEGASVQSIDQALYEFGMPMGPLALMDLTGLEVNVKMRAQADPDIIDQNAFSIVDRLYALGRKGQRSGAGFYQYESGNSKPNYDDLVDGWIAEEAKKHSVKRRKNIAASEIVDRCMLSLANEGARILEEGIAMRSGDIDVTYFAGYGFPRHLGGPMFWAEQERLAKVARRVTSYYERYKTSHWRPSVLLSFAAEQGTGFDQALKQIQTN
jgi:3-hydroxyacyl-CoA dehydrogenase